MITCPKCGSVCRDVVGRLFDGNDKLKQESLQCSNPKCGFIVDVPAE